MAVIEIARIQVRRGQENITGIPVLSPGEFGWAEDTEHLYIGKSVGEGAVNNNNTRILTENDVQTFYNGVVSTTTAYSYEGHIPGFAVTATITRSLQSKLDDNVSILDFGSVGDGITVGDNIGLQSAIDHLYLNSLVKTQTSNQSRLVIKIPAGTYEINSTIYVPPYVTLIGEGPQNTILNLTTTSAALFQFVDQTSSIGGNYVKFVDGSTNIQGSTHPADIRIEGMTLKYDSSIPTVSTLPLVRIDCATDCVISNVQFLGTYTVATSQSSNNNYTGIDIRGQGILTTKDLIVNNCTFESLYYGIKSNYDIEDPVIINSRFRNLNRGIVFAESSATANLVGPKRARFENNKFYTIEREGIYVGNSYFTSTATNHISSFNVFRNVGNNGGGDATPLTPVINFQTNGNGSLGDYTSRFDYINNGTPASFSSSLFASGKAYVENLSVYTANIVNSLTPVTLTSFPFSGVQQSNRIVYNITQSARGVSRAGELVINSTEFNGAATVQDRYSYSGPDDSGINFSVSLNSSTQVVSLLYTSPYAAGTINYKYSALSNV